MEMTIDKAISWLLSIAEHEGEDIPIYDTDVEAIKIGIETMRKYQKIERIVKHWVDVDLKESPSIADTNTIEEILEVLEDGNVEQRGNT